MIPSSTKAQNDPWSPLPETNNLFQPPTNPHYQMIDSKRYIETLEKKLNRIRSKQKKEPTSSDIIKSLSAFRGDQMKRYLENDPSYQGSSVQSSELDTTFTSYVQCRLHPEQQAVTTEELFELLKDDHLSRVRVLDEEGDDPVHCNGHYNERDVISPERDKEY